MSVTDCPVFIWSMTMTKQLVFNLEGPVANAAGPLTSRWRSASFIFAAIVVVHCIGATPLKSQTVIDKKSEYNVKAVYLYSFGRYVSWPEDAFASSQSAFIIGVLGDNPFGNALQQIARTKSVHGRSIELRQFARAIIAQNATCCSYPTRYLLKHKRKCSGTCATSRFCRLVNSTGSHSVVVSSVLRFRRTRSGSKSTWKRPSLAVCRLTGSC